jgi:Family of unknown function (DUF6370)
MVINSNFNEPFKQIIMIKSFFTVLLSCLLLNTAIAQDSAKNIPTPNPAKKILLAEASCGKCKFGMAGDDCELAVRINGKSYYLDGASIDAFGNAHAADGFCNVIRRSKVQGRLWTTALKQATSNYYLKQPEKQ